MADRKPCRANECENTIAHNIASDFCFSCSTELAFQERELEKDLDHVLTLEAEFVDWCRRNNQPNPHE